nr:hypothetical protein [Herpetosiphon sp.]
TPEHVAQDENSHTAVFLREILKNQKSEIRNQNEGEGESKPTKAKKATRKKKTEIEEAVLV